VQIIIAVIALIADTIAARYVYWRVDEWISEHAL
jgi:hypothetical protein